MELITVLNRILEFIECPYKADSLIIISGQRTVFKASHRTDGTPAVLKASKIIPTNVARIKREILLLKEIDSGYFPKFYYEYYVTAEELNNYRDNLNNETDKEKIEAFDRISLVPVHITTEEFIHHQDWNVCRDHFYKNEDDFVTFLIDLFRGLNILWDKKIVHRDLKPENILVKNDFKPVIIDLGIAKNMDPAATGITHHLFPSPCTPAYAAMEQLTNSKTEVTYKTDQFAVGVIAYWILANNPPYGAIDTIGVEGVVENMKNSRITKLSNHKTDINPGLEAFVHKLLESQPFKRFRTSDEIEKELTEILGNL